MKGNTELSLFKNTLKKQKQVSVPSILVLITNWLHRASQKLAPPSEMTEAKASQIAASNVSKSHLATPYIDPGFVNLNRKGKK